MNNLRIATRLSDHLLSKLQDRKLAGVTDIDRTNQFILIHESNKPFNEIITAGKAQGMITFDEFIISLYEEGKIDEATATAYASRKDIVGRGLDTIKSARGEATTNIDSLEIDRGYGGKRK